MSDNKVLGVLGENIAWEYLSGLGYKVLERNFRCRMGEIDIIAVHGDAIAFVEVKTRSSEDYGFPSEAVSKGKQRRIIKTALYYMQKNNFFDYMCRFDILEIIFCGEGNHRINLIRDAFCYSGRYGY